MLDQFQTANPRSSPLTPQRQALTSNYRRLAMISGSFSATRNPGVDQNFTDLAAVVQLRLRVAIGLQALQ